MVVAWYLFGKAPGTSPRGRFTIGKDRLIAGPAPDLLHDARPGGRGKPIHLRMHLHGI